MSYHNKNSNSRPLIITIPALILLGICWPLSVVYVIVACFIADKL